MGSANFYQILCRNISNNGEDIIGIFDTLICENRKVRFSIGIFYSQIADQEGQLDKYYYRLVLRYLGNLRSESKHYRVDSGIFWEGSPNDDAVLAAPFVNLKSSVPGFSGSLNINYGFDAEMPGNYELDLYVKKLQGEDGISNCEELSVKDLKLVSVRPFQLIFPNS